MIFGEKLVLTSGQDLLLSPTSRGIKSLRPRIQILTKGRNGKPKEEFNMSIHLKRTVSFFCILCLGLGCCLGNLANAVAENPPVFYRMFMAGVFGLWSPPTYKISGRVSYNGNGLPDVLIYNNFPDNPVQVAVTNDTGYYEFTGGDNPFLLVPQKSGYQFNPPSIDIPVHTNDISGQDFTPTWPREISGRVTYFDGSGFANVGIYHNTIQIAVTDGQGYYRVSLFPSELTLIPQASGYLFTPPSRSIPADQSNHGNEDFTALTVVTISGNVKEAYTTLPFTATMEAYDEDGSLRSRIVTGVDGNYSIPVPSTWTGWVKPLKSSAWGFGSILKKSIIPA